MSQASRDWEEINDLTLINGDLQQLIAKADAD
jgi:hypothetical protein